LAIPLTQGEVHFRYSAWYASKVAAGCGFLVVLISAALALRFLKTNQPLDVTAIIISLTVGLIAIWGFLWGVRAISQRRSIVSISMRGVKDIRIAKDWIPWHKITSVTRFESKKIKTLHLGIDPEFKSKIPRHPMLKSIDANFAKLVHKLFEPSQIERILAPKIALSPVHLDTSVDGLVEAIKRFAPNPDLTRGL
jgi:hypothetical protein